MDKKIITDMLNIQLADYQDKLFKAETKTMQSYFSGKINATLDIIDRVYILYI